MLKLNLPQIVKTPDDFGSIASLLKRIHPKLRIEKIWLANKREFSLVYWANKKPKRPEIQELLVDQKFIRKDYFDD